MNEPVAWRVKITDYSGKTMYVYTECLPFEPLADSGVKIRIPPEPLYVGWLDIKTAPKDGTSIDIWAEGEARHRCLFQG